ncbi:MAG: tetratricopeptide repeat protein [Vicinamibacteria bacterium]
MKHVAAGLLAGLLAASASAQKPAGVIDVRSSVPPNRSLAGLWQEYQRVEQSGDAEGATKALADIVRVRAERNIASLEPMALALVSKGLARLRGGEREASEVYLNGALALDPYLPDAYLAMAQAQVRRGPLGFAPAARQTLAGLTAGLQTSRGRMRLAQLVIPALLLAFAVTAAVAGAALLIHYGPLLLHDLEEELSPTRGPAFARGVFAALLLLPAVLFQGYGWLALWAMALVFVYVSTLEKVAIGLVLAAGIGVGPLIESFEQRLHVERNPLYRAAREAVEGGADPTAIAALAGAAREHPDDNDLKYLLARLYRKAGRDAEAETLYRQIIEANSKDPVALNNLANLEFARAEFAAAIARYKQGVESAGSPEFGATFYYNLSQAHLQRFEFQPATEARAQADRLAGGLTKSYESAWKYDKGGTAVASVVDLALTPEQLEAKFAGAAEGVPHKNVAGRPLATSDAGTLARALISRFLVFAGVFVVAVAGLSRWRGSKLFTLRCPKCGVAFCRRCHLGQAEGGLCTQCFHLFVVRDGVSATARNQKLLEVQKEEDRRLRAFRLLSLFAPGAGHVYARAALPGLVLLFLWFSLLALLVLAGRPVTLTDAPSTLVGPWVLLPPALLLFLVWVVAYRWRPSFDVELPTVRRAPTRRPPASQGA